MKDAFIQIARDTKEYLRWLKYKKNLPKNSMHDDVYIVEFPKSGITWFSFILINIQNIIEGRIVEATFYNYHRYVVDIHQIRGAEINRKNDFMFIKSHSMYNPFYYFVIYLIRNPFDVMVSYYNFSCSFGYKKNFEYFLKDKNMGVFAWKKHVNSWHHKKNDVQKIHFVKYEDIKDAPFDSLNNIFMNLGWKIDEEIVKKAIEMSCMKSMTASEEHYKKFNKNYSMTFVGGKSKKKKNELFTDDLRKYLFENLHDELSIFYPEFLS